MGTETIFTYAAPRLKFGSGSSNEIGHDIGALGASRVMVVTDPNVAATGHPQRIADAIGASGLDVGLYADAHVEPNNASLSDAVEYARDTGPWDGFVAVGGGSSIDTAKAMSLLTSNDGTLMDYVNAPVGGGRKPTQPIHPLVAVPTTTGTGSESTSVCVLDVLEQRVKTGISHDWLRPVLAVVDPELARTQPPEVVASAGMDILCHALESYTARPYTAFSAKHADERVPYCGANPISDMWSEHALGLLSRSFRSAVRDPSDVEASKNMSMAATFAGLGFGNAGVHIPHANGYPIAGQVEGYHPPGYPAEESMVPHGMSVALTAPECFRLTFETSPERHVTIAGLLAPQRAASQDDEALPQAMIDLMQDIGMPNGLAAVGFEPSQVDDLVAGTMKQQRLLSIAPLEVHEADVAGIFERSMQLW